MKKYLVILLAIAGFVACTNNEDLVSPTPTPPTPNSEDLAGVEEPILNLAKTPDFTMYSGTTANILTTSFETRAGVNDYRDADYIDFKNIDDHSYESGAWYPEFKKNQPEYVTDDEKAFVVDYIEHNMDKALDHLPEPDEIGYWFMLDCGSCNKEWNIQRRVYQNGRNIYVDEQFKTGEQMTSLRVAAPQPGDGSGCLISSSQVFSDPLVQSMGLIALNGYSIEPFKYGDKMNNRWYNDQYKVFVITYEGKTAYYVGMNYILAGWEGQFIGWEDDGIYNDWVIKLVPADGSPVEPIDPPTISGEVEVNLAVNDDHEKGDWIQSKLSLHVRANCDVEAFLPVPSDYYCEADDFAISTSHGLNQAVYGTYATINSTNVSVSVTYEPTGIRIRTSGITQNVIDYCNIQYGDGVTFEIYNYYNTLSREVLRTYLDRSEITFDADADFKCTKNEDQPLGGYDCTVTRKQ